MDVRLIYQYFSSKEENIGKHLSKKQTKTEKFSQQEAIKENNEGSLVNNFWQVVCILKYEEVVKRDK
jgi:hypothetical protein